MEISDSSSSWKVHFRVVGQRAGLLSTLLTPGSGQMSRTLGDPPGRVFWLRSEQPALLWLQVRD